MSGEVAVVGCGGIGGLAGFYMAQAREAVIFIDANEDHVNAIREKGLTVDGVYGPMAIGPQVAFTAERIACQLDSLVFLACKSRDTANACAAILPHLGPSGCVISLQNGMNEATISSAVGRERTMGALPDYGGAYLSPGVLEAVHEGVVYVGELDGKITARAIEAGRLLGIGPNRCEVSEDILGRVWTKQVYGAQILVESLVNATGLKMLRDRRVQLLAGAAVREALGVASVAGIEVQRDEWFDPDWYRVQNAADTERLLEAYVRLADHLGGHQAAPRTPTGYEYVKKASGIQWDLVYRQRKSEVEHLSITRQARELGVDVPLNARVAEMYEEIEAGQRQLGWHNIDELTAFADARGLALPAP